MVSDEPYNHRSTVVVVPFSSGTWDSDIHPATLIGGTRTRAMVEQLRVLDKSKLRERIGSIAGETVMSLILEQLTYLFALDR